MNISTRLPLKKGDAARHAFVFLFMFFAAVFTKAHAYDLVVAKDGSGNYTTVQAALNAAPTNGTTPFVIYIKNGKYREKISIASNKPFVQLVGESVANTIVYYDDPATVLGTQNSASFSVNANDFSAFNITFANTFGDGSQAVAVLVNADRAVFKNCRFLGNQDTLYIKGGSPGKCYFLNCYIDGNVDFIFGSSVALFDSCVVYAKSRTSAGSSFITAPNTPSGQSFGYVFRNARFPANTGATSYFISRPWPSPSESQTAQKTVLLNSRLSASVNPLGWTTWDANTITSNIYYGEYNSQSFNGVPIDVSQRVAWSYQLNAAAAAAYTIPTMFGAWDPCSVYPGSCNSQGTDIAVSNFRGAKGASSSTFNWNISWPLAGIRYQLYRSSDNISFSQIDDMTAATDTAVNFQSTDVLPPAGTIYYYYVSASKPGYSSHITDTIQISSKPAISIVSAMGTFNQGLGSPSSTQSYTVSGVNMVDNITIVPPLNYEVSANGTTWFTNSNPLVLIPTNNAIAGTTITVRLNANALGTYNGTILHTSGGADAVSLAVAGTTNAVGPNPSIVLQMWPFTVNNSDDAAIRSSTVLASTPTLTNLNISNGQVSPTTGVAIPSYSTNFGQALAPTADGLWTIAAGGPGGNLNRRNYEQFIITAAPGNTIRLDSVIMNSAFVSTVSNIRLGLGWSLNGFSSPADSAELFSGITGQPPVAITTVANATFLKAVPLTQQNNGPVPAAYNYRLALTSGAGITLTGGQSVTIRIYFSCGSGSGGKYITLRDLTMKGGVLVALPLNLLSFTAAKTTAGAALSWKTTNELNTDHFIIEASKDVRNFNPIGTVQAKKGTASNQYSFTDVTFEGTVYYRLQMVDVDGKSIISNIIKLDAKAALQLSVYPNPVAKTLYVLHGRASDNAVIQLYSATGAKLKVMPVMKGATQTIIATAELPAGTIIARYSDNEKVASVTIMKQ